MKTLAEVVAKFPSEVRERYDFSGACYTGALAPITGIVCAAHGSFRQYAAQLRKGGAGCPACGDTMRKAALTTPADAYFEKVRAVHAGKYDYSAVVFTKMNAPLTGVRCPRHGLFTLTANHHYYRKQGCPACAQESRLLGHSTPEARAKGAASKIANTGATFFLRCAEVHAGRYTYPEQAYPGAKQKIRAVCAVHGEFEQAAHAHLSGKGCSACGAYDAKWERELIEYIAVLGYQAQRSAAVLGGKHVDVYIPERKFGVELHGLRWHTESKRGKLYHRQKWALAQKHGIKLLQVFEDEWYGKRAIVEARIAAMLGHGPRFDARKCAVGPCDPTQARAFLNATHIQGAGLAKLFYGLWAGGALVAVATFGKSRSGAMTGAEDAGVWEVMRYASTGRVRGGFGRLFKAFLKDVVPTKVVSYCDLRYGDGRVYAATGFTLDKVTEPDYWWVQDGKVERIPRYMTQKHKLAAHPVLGVFYSPEKSESEICAEAGWERIYGVGHQRWVYVDTSPAQA